jgi:septum formation protein
MSRDASPVILASSSPRRQELLAQAGVLYTVHVSGCDETQIPGESAQEMVERLALLKAKEVARYYPGAWVIGADTTVFIGGVCLGKPTSDQEAHEMLRTIQGKTHEVWGGIAIVREESQHAVCWSHVTSVTMCSMSDAMIREYIATGEPLDKAGSYAIQGIGLQFVDRIEGSYSNVVGLNIASLMHTLRELQAHERTRTA